MAFNYDKLRGKIREKLLRSGNIYAVIGLPANLFYNTSIPTCIVVLKKHREGRDVLFIDASQKFEKGKKQNAMTDGHIESVMKLYNERVTVDKEAYLASFEDIERNDFNLNIPRYVDNFEIYKYASLADIQCVPSLWQEAAGLVVLEAMAEGIPTIVTRSGGMVEYVTEETSIIIEQKNVIENLKQAILFMKENPKIRKEMSEASKVQGKKFNTEIYYRDFVKIMKKIIGAN